MVHVVVLDQPTNLLRRDAQCLQAVDINGEFPNTALGLRSVIPSFEESAKRCTQLRRQVGRKGIDGAG